MIRKVCRTTSKLAMLPRGAAFVLLKLTSRRLRVDDFEVVDATDNDSPRAEDQLLKSIELIRRELPAVYRRLRRDVRRVILVKAGGPEYWPFAKAIVVKKTTVEQAEVALLAMLLVHEGTHARLWNIGIGYPVKERARIERLCVSAEVRLARELPDAAELEEFALDKLKNAWWTEAAIAERTKRARKLLAEDR
jgi:hypothetical protein